MYEIKIIKITRNIIQIEASEKMCGIGQELLRNVNSWSLDRLFAYSTLVFIYTTIQIQLHIQMTNTNANANANTLYNTNTNSWSLERLFAYNTSCPILANSTIF